jgi:hypothetical protein
MTKWSHTHTHTHTHNEHNRYRRASTAFWRRCLRTSPEVYLQHPRCRGYWYPDGPDKKQNSIFSFVVEINILTVTVTVIL